MSWPPVKSWTTSKPINGFNHFVAINYGGIGSSRWVLLVAVLDGTTRLRLAWDQIKDSPIWINEWSFRFGSVKNDEIEHNNNSALEAFNMENVCLHPSKDSGLQIPSNQKKIRKWSESKT
tara:strand:+ start:393 stop:752 length:360 start_codon:yes stop_codon:yes gene_type:complete